MGDIKTAADETLAVKGDVRDKEPAAAPAARSLRAGNAPTLSGEAILALQGDGTSQPAASRRRGDGQGTPGANSSETDASGAGGDTQAGGASGQNTAQASGQSEEESSKDPQELTQEEEKQVDKLQQRDREVRAHEAAHARTGGPHAGAPSYTFQQGPDGKRYAIGGEVSIDTSAERTPEATIRKMQTVIRAATAPAEPSSQDLKVAQQARAQLAEAQAEARTQRAEELQSDDEDTDASGGAEAGKESKSGAGAERASAASGDEGAGSSSSSDQGRSSDLFAAIQSYQSAGQLGAFGDRQPASAGLFA
ncbi:hypothetical protein IG616_20115 [Labrenzia suaedae]|uniref:SprA-related family protein n=2 Tax=Roseibium litorale TaxID=2803841 RepID=A0ABR9CSK1_9HYPH|nr:hypothetical protein [Roseibium litorale]